MRFRMTTICITYVNVRDQKDMLSSDRTPVLVRTHDRNPRSINSKFHYVRMIIEMNGLRTYVLFLIIIVEIDVVQRTQQYVVYSSVC